MSGNTTRTPAAVTRAPATWVVAVVVLGAGATALAVPREYAGISAPTGSDTAPATVSRGNSPADSSYPIAENHLAIAATSPAPAAGLRGATLPHAGGEGRPGSELVTDAGTLRWPVVPDSATCVLLIVGAGLLLWSRAARARG